MFPYKVYVELIILEISFQTYFLYYNKIFDFSCNLF
jgi:hypothetical protein